MYALHFSPRSVCKQTAMLTFRRWRPPNTRVAISVARLCNYSAKVFVFSMSIIKTAFFCLSFPSSVFKNRSCSLKV